MNIGTLWITLGADVTGLNKATTALNTTAQRFRTFGYLASAAVTAPMILAGKSAMKLASDYEFAMQKIVGLTGEAQDAVNEWSAEVLKMAPELARGPQELADALYFISSSGIKGAAAMDVLEVSAKAATAGLGSTQDVANLLTSVLNAYAGTGITAAYATDVLVAAVREGKAEADQFATSVGSVIPYAAQLGVSFDEVAGAMAAMTLTGASAANSATYLRNFLMKLIKPAAQSVDMLESLGMTFEDLRKIVAEQGLMPALEKVRDLTNQYGIETLGKIFPNIRAMLLYLSLMGKNAKYNSELMERVTNSTGALGEAFKAVADTIKVRYDVAISASKVALISLGKSIAETFLPILEKLVERLTKLTEWFNNLSEAEKRNRLVKLAWIAAAGPIAMGLSLIMYTLSGLVTLVKYATTVFRILNKVMLKNPWVLVATGIAGAVGWLIHFKKKSDEAAIAQSSFNTALVQVNGSIKLLKSLTDIDYTNMNVTELLATMKEANKQYMLAKKNIKDIQDRVESGEQKKAGVQHYIDLQTDDAIKAKKAYEGAAAALQAWGDNFGKIGGQIPQFAEDLEDVTEEVKKVTSAIEAMNEGLAKITQTLKSQGVGGYEGDWRATLSGGLGSVRLGSMEDKNRLAGAPKVMGTLDILENQHEMALMSEREYLKKKYALQIQSAMKEQFAIQKIALHTYNYTKALRDLNFEDIQSYLNSLSSAINAISSLIEASKQKELSAVGDNARRREQIEKEYMQKQKAWAIAQAIINGALAITNLIANIPGSVINPATWVGIGVAAAATAAQIAIIAGQKMKEGGIVPSGYPNDSYPARLTSGEMVVPPNKLESLMPRFDERLVAEVTADQLNFILTRKYRKTNSYK